MVFICLKCNNPTYLLSGNFTVFTLKNMFKIKKEMASQKKNGHLFLSNFQKWKEKFAKK